MSDNKQPSTSVPTDTTTPTTESVVAERPIARKKFLDNMSIYGLEMTVAMITLIIVASVMSWGLFSLCNYFYNQEDASLGYFSLWTASSTIVWLPVAYIFYRRSRSYMADHPQVVNSTVQRTFVMIYQVAMIIAIISFSFTAVFAFLTGLTKTSDMGQTLVGVALPAALSAVVFGGAFIAFFRQPVVSRKLFANGMLLTAILIVVPIIVYSIISLRSTSVDVDRVSDLNMIHSAATDYYSDNRKLPDSLEQLANDKNLKLKKPQSEYEYNKKERADYELCTTFVSDTTSDDSYRSSSSSSTYQNFSKHGSGKQCFTQSAGYFYDRNSRYDDF